MMIRRTFVVTELDQYHDSFILAGVGSLKTLFAYDHDELNKLVMEMNMEGEDLIQLQINIYMHKHGPLSPISPIPFQSEGKWTPNSLGVNAGHKTSPDHNVVSQHESWSQHWTLKKVNDN